MNRDFLIRNITPAAARKILALSSLPEIKIDPSIVDIASKDMLTTDQFDSPVRASTLDLIQFIIDHNWRCIIPYDFGMETIEHAIEYAIPKDQKVLIIGKPEFLRNIKDQEEYNENSTKQFQYISNIHKLTPMMAKDLRDRVVLADLEFVENGFAWIGKMFPKIVVICPFIVQYRFMLESAASHDSSVGNVAKILFPNIAKNMTKGSKNAANLPLYGAYSKFISEKQPKRVIANKKHSFLVLGEKENSK